MREIEKKWREGRGPDWASHGGRGRAGSAKAVRQCAEKRSWLGHSGKKRKRLTEENGPWGGGAENREEKKRGGCANFEKTAPKAAGNRIPFLFSDPFINCKVI
jgi:hypothetical protein